MSLYNKDELVAPSWINEQFFEKVLKQYEKNEHVHLNKLAISPASMKGDHYASIMFRCQVTYDIENLESVEKSLILKTLPDEGAKAEFLQQSKAFETEISMYTETLPKIEQILAECGEPTKLAAEIIYHSLEPHKTLILEDLCTSGYDTLRTRYITEDELRMVYRKIAKLHAVSFMLSQGDDHVYVTKYNEGVFSNSSAMSVDFMSGGILRFIELLSQHEEFKIYLEKVKLMQPEMFKMCIFLYNAYKADGTERDIFVLNHGDFHMKNLMFKLNSKDEAEDVIMVDYQFSCFAPSNIDLIYSQYMMMTSEFRMKRNEFMQYYFSEFIKILKKINYQGKLPLYSDFQIANLKYRHFTLFLVATFVPFINAFQDAKGENLEGREMSEFIENSNATAILYNNPVYLDILRQLLPSLLADGYLD